MQFNWTILAWIAAVIFVYVFGIFEGRGQGYKKRKAEEEEEKKQNKQGQQPAAESEKVMVDDPGLLRIKNENGSISLDLDGARVNTSSLSAEERKRLIELLNVMRPWLESKSAPAPTKSASASVDSRLDSVSAPPPAAPKPVSSPPPARKKDEKAEAAPMTMVGQINEILQAHIVNTKFSTQGVTLLESPSGGVNVYVGIDRYEGIELCAGCGNQSPHPRRHRGMGKKIHTGIVKNIKMAIIPCHHGIALHILSFYSLIKTIEL